MRKQYLEKEEQYQKLKVEVNILKGKLKEKDKQLRFQDSLDILDNIFTNQRSPSIKYGCGFHEFVKEESSSQARGMKLKDKDIRIQPNQHPRKLNFQRKSFAPNNRNINQFSPLINDDETHCNKF